MDFKFVLVTMATRLENLVVRYNTLSQARFYIEHLGADFSDYELEHNRYQESLENCKKQLALAGRLQVLPREYLPNYLFGPDDVVVALGRDGLVANTLKYLKGQPLFGVNPEPQRWDGVLLPFTPPEVGESIQSWKSGRTEVKTVTMAQVTLGDGRSLLAVNDLFIGTRSHISSRYTLSLGDKEESQSSSGIIVSTGLGSSGWLKSIVAGAQGILQELGGQGVSQGLTIPWDADYLYYTVREPFPSLSSQAGLVFGKVTAQKPMRVLSQMPESGVIFSDGVEKDYLEFTSGTRATIGLSPTQGHLVQKVH